MAGRSGFADRPVRGQAVQGAAQGTEDENVKPDRRTVPVSGNLTEEPSPWLASLSNATYWFHWEPSIILSSNAQMMATPKIQIVPVMR